MKRLLFLFLFPAIVWPAFAQINRGFVITKVIDGNTLEVEGGRIIKVGAVEAPRLDQPFGKEAKAHLEQLVLLKWANAECRWRDGFDRCDLMVEGKRVIHEMLEAGLAVIHDRVRYNEHLRFDREVQRMLAIESAAKEDKRGLWSQDDFVMPWVWDAMKAAKQQEEAERLKAKQEATRMQARESSRHVKEVKAAEKQGDRQESTLAKAAREYVQEKAAEAVKEAAQEQIKNSLAEALKRKMFGR